MKKDSMFWTVLGVTAAIVTCVIVMLSPTEPTVETPAPAPVTVTVPIVTDTTPKALFAVGDKVRLDDQVDAFVVEVGEIDVFIRIADGAEVEARSYVVAVTEENGDMTFYRVPELILAKK